MKTTKEEPVKAVKPSKKTTGRAAKELTANPKNGLVLAKDDAAENLKDFLEDGLKDIYWAEKELTKALAKMAKNATSTQLIKAFEDHLKETEEHVKRLEQVFESLGVEAVAKKCDVMAGLLDKTDEIIQETEVGNVRDAAMIAAAQKVEHYEIAAYGTLRVYAVTLGKTRTALLLAKTLAEEKNADIKLTEIAVSHINIDAAHEGHK